MPQVFDVSGLDAYDAAIRVLALGFPFAVLLTLLSILRVRRKAASRVPLADTVTQAPSNTPRDWRAAEDSAPRPTPGGISNLTLQFDQPVASQVQAMSAHGYLELARQHRQAGDERACHEALRAAAGMAARFGPQSVHAEARLELAEAAYAAGDLTGACEQWQMARTALHDDGQKDAYARIEKRMRDNGCPTDWVLTDF
jgi:hypothetical protein